MTNFKMTVNVDCAVSACTHPLPLPKKALTHWLMGWGAGLWTWVHPQLLFWQPLKISKLLFAPTLVLDLEQWAAGGPHSWQQFSAPSVGLLCCSRIWVLQVSWSKVIGHGSVPGADDTYRMNVWKAFVWLTGKVLWSLSNSPTSQQPDLNCT